MIQINDTSKKIILIQYAYNGGGGFQCEIKEEDGFDTKGLRSRYLRMKKKKEKKKERKQKLGETYWRYSMKLNLHVLS